MVLENGYHSSMGKLHYKKELVKSMKYLEKNKNVIFLGQSVKYSGNAIFSTLKDISTKKKNRIASFRRNANGFINWTGFIWLYSCNVLP